MDSQLEFNYLYMQIFLSNQLVTIPEFEGASLELNQILGGRNRYYKSKIHLRGLLTFKPTEVGFVSVAPDF